MLEFGPVLLGRRVGTRGNQKEQNEIELQPISSISPVNMAPCTATKLNGEPCTAPAKKGSTFCGRHGGNAKEVVPQCRHRYNWRGQRRRCSKNATTEGFCAKHHVKLEKKRKRKESGDWVNRIWREIERLIWEDDDVARCARMIEAAFAEERIISEHYIDLSRRYADEVARYDQVERIRGRRPFVEPVFPPVRNYDQILQLADQLILWGPQGTPDRPGLNPQWLDDMIIPPPPPVPEGLGELGRLAYDNQNVHTREVNENVNTSLDILLGVRDPVNGFEGYWSHFPKTKENRAMRKDMFRWYNTETCRSESDWLYRKTLDGLWTLIDRSPFKDELVVRLTQEADESVGQCCDGHIARLCNVMVGFDAAFKAPVSATEILGDRIGAIAAMDLSVEAKVVEAWRAFEELHIDHETRKEWISAL